MHFKSALAGLSLALSITIGIALRATATPAANAGSSARHSHPKIGLSLDTLKEARWQSDRDNFVARVQQLGSEVDVQSANGDDATQIQNCTSLLSGGADVLVIAAHNGKAMARAVELAHAQNVPVISYDRLIADCDVDLYMSFDNLTIGRLQGQYVVDQLKALSHPPPLRIVRIYGAKTDNNAVLYKNGQDQALQASIDSGQIKVIHEDWAEDWKPENAKAITNAAITAAGRDIDVILASNDGTAGGAIQALSEEGLAAKVKVTGQDAELVACQRIVQGTQSMTIYKPIKQLATRAAEFAVALGQGKPVIANAAVNNGQIDVPSVLFNSVVVTRDNIDQTVVQDRFHSHDEIFAR